MCLEKDAGSSASAHRGLSSGFGSSSRRNHHSTVAADLAGQLAMVPLLTWGPDEEAVVDLGKPSSTVNTKFEKEELESHRAVYIGVHAPFRKELAASRHRGHKHHHRRRKDKDLDKEDVENLPLMIPLPRKFSLFLVLRMATKNIFPVICSRKWKNCVTEMEKNMSGKKLPDG